MQKYWSPSYPEGLEVFSATHLITLVVIAAVNILLLGWLKMNYSQKVDKWFRYILAGILLLGEILLILWYSLTGIWDWGFSLPLHLCRIAAFMAAFMLITDHKKIYRLEYFIGLGAAIPALITPDLPYGFPHFGFFKFFIAHSGILTAVLYMTVIKGYRPYFRSLGKTFMLLNIMLPFIGLINWLTGGNYFYLAHKPPGFSLMDYLGRWPWYILSMELIGVIFFLIFYLPFLIKDIKAEKSS